ncbi:MAG: hypothetical protein RLO81_02490 [Fulvivirga sp.]|uniref:hypothetical protein n=1 Tax=Fulvivirga sp. TaxID=1931237 RepID=UPI0032ED1F95
MIQIESSYKPLLLEALEEMMYKLSLELSNLKGGPMDKQRKLLTDKQAKIEKLQHIISIA